MAKIELDKYYTTKELSQRCIDKTFEIIGYENITDIVEPSAGSGSFSDLLKCTAYDIAPEGKGIIQQDFLKLDMEYLKGRLTIGNPPYGVKLNLAQKFYKKATTIGDYVAFILPISQLNQNRTFYQFDLIYSEDLGLQPYSGVMLHCCFNIYKKSESGINRKPKNDRLNDITIIRNDSKKFEVTEYDLRMCYWGNASAGKIITDPSERYSGEFKIIIHRKELKDKIIEVLSNTEWDKELNKIAMLRIRQFDIYRVLRREVPDIN